MGAGYHGGFGKTSGAVAGDAVYTSSPYEFFLYIARRKDVDKDGIIDIVSHGKPYTIKLNHNGNEIELDARVMARIIKLRKDYKQGQPVRLLSCNTGSKKNGFAQSLADHLGVPVIAPTKILWAYPNGKYTVAGGREDDNKHVIPVMSDRGIFKTFYPGGYKK